MQTKHATLLFLLLWLGGGLVWGQRFKNASDFMGDSAQDQLIQTGGMALPSNELLLVQPTLDQLPDRQERYQVFDFLASPGDPSASILARNRYRFTEADPQGTTATNLPSTPEVVAVTGDFDGDGFDEVIRAMEDDHGEILVFANDRLAVGDNDTLLSFLNDSELLYRIPASAGGYLPILDGHPTLKLQAVNLGESDRDHLIVSYLRRVSDSLFQLSVDLWQDSLVASYEADIPFADAHDYGFAPHYDLSVADFELDGVPEIVVAYYELPFDSVRYDICTGAVTACFVGEFHQRITILKLERDQLTVSLDKQLPTPNAIYVEEGPSVLGQTQSTIHVLPIDVNQDMVPEIVLLNPENYDLHLTASPFWKLQSVTLHGSILQLWDDSLKQGVSAFDTLIQVGSLSEWTGYRYFAHPRRRIQFNSQAECGDVDGDERPELVMGFYQYSFSGGQSQVASFGLSILEFSASASDPDSVLITQELEDYQFLGTWQPHPIPRRFLQVSDLDGDGIEEIIRYRHTGGNTLLEALRYVPGGASGGGDTLETVGEKSLPTPTGTSFQLLAGDFDGDGLWLGTPRYFRQTAIQQPLVVLNAPPIHFDYLNGQVYDINGCYTGSGPCDFSATYRKIVSRSFTASTEFHSDWAVSAGVSGGISTPVAKVESKLSTTYGESFSSYRGMGQSISIKTEVTATVEDLIYATVLDYGIYEYPIYQGDSLVGHVMTITPELTQNRWFSTDSWSAFDYFPRHEVGNLMSYEGFFDQNDKTDLTMDPTLEEELDLMGDGLQINGSSQYAPGLNFSDFGNSSSSWGSQLSVESETTVSAGRKLFGWGAEVSASVSGSYNREEVSTFETSVSEDISVDIELGPHTAGLESNYVVSPYFYWGKNGSLIVDYTVQPEVQNQGGTDTWWNANYGQAQDPGLILPWRLHPEKGLNLQEPIKQLQSKSITYSPRNAQPGDVITIYAAVHNYSLLPTDGRVEVAFYLGNPNCSSGQRLTSIDGQTSAFTEGTEIPARGRRLVAFSWRIPEDVTTAPRIYVQLDPDGEMNEIHEDNNLGWTILNVQGSGSTQYCNELTTTSLAVVAQEATQVLAFPNPFTRQTTLRFDLPQGSEVKLEVLDLTGRRVATLIDGFRFAGRQEVTFDGADRPAGVYLYRLQVGEQVQSGKLHLQR